jgi:hypothetical protein
MPEVDYTMKRFEPCRGHRHCEACTGSFFDPQGERVVCTCDCHQPGLFKVRESVQRDLFR